MKLGVLLAASSVVVLFMSASCGGPPEALAVNGQRLPANGTPKDAPLTQLPSKTLTRESWDTASNEGLLPTCDARHGVRAAEAPDLERAGKIVDTWSELHTAKGKSRTADGARLGRSEPEPTRDVNSVGLICAAGASYLQVNGLRYPFDLAWIVYGKGHAKTLDGIEGAGEFAMIQALSYEDKRVVFAKVYVPSDAHDDTDDTIVVSSLEGYLPENPEAPVVRAVGEREDPQLETFIFSKGATEGISFRVARQDPLGRARYLSVGRFAIGQ